ncbi:unnamed protein product [Amaranthus hypochondriacus]
MRDLSELITDIHLAETNSSGGYFSWTSKGIGNRVQRRIDWAFGNDVWMLHNSHVKRQAELQEVQHQLIQDPDDISLTGAGTMICHLYDTRGKKLLEHPEEIEEEIWKFYRSLLGSKATALPMVDLPAVR